VVGLDVGAAEGVVARGDGEGDELELGVAGGRKIGAGGGAGGGTRGKRGNSKGGGGSGEGEEEGAKGGGGKHCDGWLFGRLWLWWRGDGLMFVEY